MKKVARKMIKRVSRDESGQALAEYALLLALIAVAAIGSITALSGEINDLFTLVANELADAA